MKKKTDAEWLEPHQDAQQRPGVHALEKLRRRIEVMRPVEEQHLKQMNGQRAPLRATNRTD